MHDSKQGERRDCNHACNQTGRARRNPGSQTHHRPIPQRGVGEILIRVRAAGVNPVDVMAQQSGVFVGGPPFHARLRCLRRGGGRRLERDLLPAW